jgi:hypothetical protein
MKIRSLFFVTIIFSLLFGVLQLFLLQQGTNLIFAQSQSTVAQSPSPTITPAPNAVSQPLNVTSSTINPTIPPTPHGYTQPSNVTPAHINPVVPQLNQPPQPQLQQPTANNNSPQMPPNVQPTAYSTGPSPTPNVPDPNALNVIVPVTSNVPVASINSVPANVSVPPSDPVSPSVHFPVSYSSTGSVTYVPVSPNDPVPPSVPVPPNDPVSPSVPVPPNDLVPANVSGNITQHSPQVVQYQPQTQPQTRFQQQQFQQQRFQQQPPTPPTSESIDKSEIDRSELDYLDKLREIYIPANELGVIFDAAKDNLLIKRNEFEKLRKQSREILLEMHRKESQPHSPVEAVLLASDYKITIENLRAVIDGTFEIELLTDDVVSIPIQFDRVSIIEAIDAETKKPAALATQAMPPISQFDINPNNEQTELLILKGKKRHKIKFVATTPLEIDSTRQRIVFQMPHGTKNSMRLTITGDVELKSGASVISRKVEERIGENNTKSLTTQFELLTNAGNQQTNITMSLNSHKSGAYQAVLARSIQFAEVTEQYEKLHATVSLTEMHQGISEAEFEIPDGFEITAVAAVLLDKWNVEKSDKTDNANKQENKSAAKLKLKFREQLPGLTTIYLSAIKVKQLPNDKSASWQFSLFNPVNVAANSTVLGLLVEQELEMTDLESKELYPIDTLALRDAIPPSTLNAAPGSPLIRLASAWYAPRGQFNVKANFKRPKNDCKIETSEVLVLADKTPTLQINYELTVRTGKLFETIIEAPPNWKIASIVTADNKNLEFRLIDDGKKNTDVQKTLVQFPHGIIAGETFEFVLSATGTIDGWFTVENEKKIKFPQFNIQNATTNTQGKIAVKYGGEEDWDIIPAADENLIPLDDSVKQNLFPDTVEQVANAQPRFQLPEYQQPQQRPQQRPQTPAISVTNIPSEKLFKTFLAYEYLSKPFDLELKLEKLNPRLSVKVASIYSFTPTLLNVNHELWFTAKHASTQRLAVLLPIETTNTPSIEKLSAYQFLPVPYSARQNANISNILPINNESKIKETYSSEVEIEGKKYRRWEIVLSKPQAGLLKLNINFDMPINPEKINNAKAQPFKLPGIIAENVEWQSDIIAIQGDEELDLQVLTDSNGIDAGDLAKVGGKVKVLRPVDAGTIAGMHNQPGKRLTGVYSAVRDEGDVVVMTQRNELLSLVTAVIENVTIIAQLGNNAVNGTLYSVTYDICTDGASVKLSLGDGDEIWSVKLDGQVMKPQRVGNDILIPVQQQLKNITQNNKSAELNNKKGLRRIELVYRSYNSSLRSVYLSFPSLTVKRAGNDVVVPIMQTRWGVIPPTGFYVTKIGDKSIATEDKFEPAAFRIFETGAIALSALLYRENDLSQYLDWLPEINISCRTANRRADKSSAPMAENENIMSEDKLEPYNDIYNDENNNRGRVLSGKESVQLGSKGQGAPLNNDTQTDLNNQERMSGRMVIDKFEIRDSSSKDNKVSIMPQQIRRLKSVQPVTVIFMGDMQAGVNYSRLGTNGIQNVEIKLASLSSRVMWSWISYLAVVLVGLMFIGKSYVFKVRFVFIVFIVCTLLVFIPYLDALATILNAAVYAILTIAIIFILYCSYLKFSDLKASKPAVRKLGRRR